jgi:thioredoxin 1
MAIMTIPQVTDSTFEHEVLASQVPVIVDFWAPWCGPCRLMEPVLTELAATQASVRVVKVNVDDNQQTAARYEILSIPTILVIAGGEVQKTLVGAVPKGKLLSELEPWLPRAA